MKLFTLTMQQLPESLADWPELQAIFARYAARQSKVWQMPRVTCEAVGGTAEEALPAMVAIACAQIGILLIDDMLDADPRGEHQHLGMPATANLAAAFQAAALETLTANGRNLAAVESLNRMLLTVAFGQYLDTQNIADETGYWRVAETKSAPFFGAAFQLGALLGGASPETAEAVRRLGEVYGVMIQIHDDLADSLAVPASPDWEPGHVSLPLLYAQQVEHPDRERFLRLRQALPDPQALAEAQEILIRCGAISYGLYHLLERHKKAQALLESLPLSQPAGLETLLAELMAPVWNLFEVIGAAPPVKVPAAQTG